MSALADIRIEDYKEKAIRVMGNTKPYREAFKSRGGSWNPTLQAWIFPRIKKVEIQELVTKILNGGVKPTEDNDSISKMDFSALSTKTDKLERDLHQCQKDIAKLTRLLQEKNGVVTKARKDLPPPNYQSDEDDEDSEEEDDSEDEEKNITVTKFKTSSRR
jgi:glutaredoxin 2